MGRLSTYSEVGSLHISEVGSLHISEVGSLHISEVGSLHAQCRRSNCRGSTVKSNLVKKSHFKKLLVKKLQVGEKYRWISGEKYICLIKSQLRFTILMPRIGRLIMLT
jgi:hypothetical protein